MLKKIVIAVISALSIGVIGFRNPTSADVNEGSTANLRQLHGLVSLGNGHTCVVMNGGVKCWGKGNQGQLGNDTTSNSVTPVDVKAASSSADLLTNVTSIAAGNLHTCALLQDTTVKCWGWNSNGQLGNGSTSSESTPVTVDSLNNIIALAAGNEHTCALLASGGVKCWGSNSDGQLGRASNVLTNNRSTSAIDIAGIQNATAISAGYAFTCVLIQSGQVKCWGDNAQGQLGDGSDSDSYTPVDVKAASGGSEPLSNVRSISVGSEHACALLANTTAKCWGYNDYWQLGIGTSGRPMTPVNVVTSDTDNNPLTGVLAISAGESHTCVVMQNTGAKCWGLGERGQLGDGTTEYRRNTPVDVLNEALSDAGLQASSNQLLNLRAISLGSSHTCAVVASQFSCWGLNRSGELGSTPSGEDQNENAYFKTRPAVVLGITFPNLPEQEQNQTPAPVVTTTVAPTTTTTASTVKKLSKLPETGSSNSLFVFAAIALTLGGAVTIARKRLLN